MALFSSSGDDNDRFGGHNRGITWDSDSYSTKTVAPKDYYLQELENGQYAFDFVWEQNPRTDIDREIATRMEADFYEQLKETGGRYPDAAE